MRAFIEVHLKLVFTIWIILISVLGLLYLMNYMKFTTLMSNVVSSKLQVMSSSIERSIIKAEQLGLPLKEMDNLPELMRRNQSRDKQVQAIYVINHQGNVLFSTEKMQLDSQHRAQLLRRALKGKEHAWSLDEKHTLYSGQQIFDSTQQLIGSTIIAYNKSSFAAVLAQVKLHLLEMTLMIFGIFALLIFIAVRLGFGEVNSVFKLINRQLSPDDTNPAEQSLKPGSMAHEFAEKITLSNEMKNRVNDELTAINVHAQSEEVKNKNG